MLLGKINIVNSMKHLAKTQVFITPKDWKEKFATVVHTDESKKNEPDKISRII